MINIMPSSDDKTLFEKIIDREVPADIWYEDDQSLVFLDINPVAAGHSLYITKNPYRWIQDLPAEVASKFFAMLPDLIEKLKSATNTDYIQVAIMGLDVPHFHVHLIPRNFGDNHNELYPNSNLSYDKAALLSKFGIK
jgi:histidine triad (HIT) family protein